ncbi:MAG: F0F1 ATP synthase subunit delta [Verrucomicrobiales bacterium]|nr:F0F1 ATP synthase subunit delta [Verrucomicrobiales bacterium]
MKGSKDAQRIARQLMKATVIDGRVDASVVRTVMVKLATDKPRGYLGVLNVYSHLVRLELKKSHAVIESAKPLGAVLEANVLADLKGKYGTQLTSEFKSNPELLGGMRVRVGSDVWDGSVRERLVRLREKFG